jgi:hypothetical protein
MLAQMSKRNDRELAAAWQVLRAACRQEKCDLHVADICFRAGAYAAFRIALKLIVDPDIYKSLNECDRLLGSVKCRAHSPPK